MSTTTSGGSTLATMVAAKRKKKRPRIAPPLEKAVAKTLKEKRK